MKTAEELLNISESLTYYPEKEKLDNFKQQLIKRCEEAAYNSRINIRDNISFTVDDKKHDPVHFCNYISNKLKEIGNYFKKHGYYIIILIEPPQIDMFNYTNIITFVVYISWMKDFKINALPDEDILYESN